MAAAELAASSDAEASVVRPPVDEAKRWASGKGRKVGFAKVRATFRGGGTGIAATAAKHDSAHQEGSLARHGAYRAGDSSGLGVCCDDAASQGFCLRQRAPSEVQPVAEDGRLQRQGAQMSGWPRRSSTRWPDAVDEDEYECMACKQWKPWFCYAGMFQLVAPFKDATHSHWLDFQRDDGGHRFALGGATTVCKSVAASVGTAPSRGRVARSNK